MRGYIRHTANLFGNFTNFDVDTKSTIEIMNVLNEYEVIPSVIKEVQIQITDNIPKQVIVDRIQLNSTSRKLLISIFGNNIIIDSQPEIDSKTGISVINAEEFISDVKKISSILLGFIKVKANRVSLVTSYINDQKRDEQYKFLIKTNEFFKDKDVFEWNMRQVIREKFDICSKIEDVNINSNIYRSKGTISTNLSQPNNFEFDGIIYEIDINTIPENIESRIDDAFIETFYDIAIKIKQDIEGMIKFDF